MGPFLNRGGTFTRIGGPTLVLDNLRKLSKKGTRRATRASLTALLQERCRLPFFPYDLVIVKRKAGCI